MGIERILTLCIVLLLGMSSSYSQKVLALDKPGKVKRIRYLTGDYIILKTDSNLRVAGDISKIEDSSFWVGKKEVALEDVKYIQKTRNNYGWNLLSTVSMTAGLGYFGIDTGNRLINNDQPVVSKGAVITSSVFMSVFILSNSIANRKYRINKRRTLKVIDIGI